MRRAKLAALTVQWRTAAPLASPGEIRHPGVDKTSPRMFRRRAQFLVAPMWVKKVEGGECSVAPLDRAMREQGEGVPAWCATQRGKGRGSGGMARAQAWWGGGATDSGRQSGK
jgi:hypothetical protein